MLPAARPMALVSYCRREKVINHMTVFQKGKVYQPY